MAAAIGLRDDYDAGALRAAAKRSKDGPQARRQLALAAIYDGATRTEAAKIGGVGLQVVGDWVMKFNADGPEGLIDRKAPGQPPRLNDGHRAALAAILESGPIPAVHGVARWRIVDLMPMDLRGIPRRRLPADSQPRAAQEGLSQALGPPSPSCPGRRRPPRLQEVLSRSPHDQSASTYPASEAVSGPRWRYARPGPHKSPGVERRFLNQVSGTPFDCQAISLSPLANLIDRTAPSSPDRPTATPPRSIP